MGRRKIEEIKEFKYLGCIRQKNGESDKYILERIKRASLWMAMKMTWSIGEKFFKENYSRRTKMFNPLVRSIALYGAEVWG